MFMNLQFNKRIPLLIVALLFCLALTGSVLAEHNLGAAQQSGATAVVNTGALNVRVGPAIGYKAVAVAYRGHVVALLGRNNAASWAKVRLFNGQEGWVNVTLIDPSVTISSLPIMDAPELTAMAAVATGALNVRSGPGIGYGSTAVIAFGTNVQLLGRNNNSSWVKVKLANGHEGWVNASLITANVAISSLPVMTSTSPLSPTAVVNTGALNVRSGPGTGYAVTGATYLGQTVSLLGRNGAADWVLIRLAGGHEGWVNAFYLQPNIAISSLGIVEGNTAVSPTATIATYALNVRSGPAATYTIVAYLSQWQTAKMVGRNSAGTWVQIQLANGTGWINAAFIQTNVAISTLPVTG
jgi:uncharacterized protein YgiM (DUF1202 family)